MRGMRDVLLPMQIIGLRVDQAERTATIERLKTEEARAQMAWDAVSGATNPRSYPQMRALLYEKWGLPVQWRREKGHNDRISTDNEAIETLLHETNDLSISEGLKILQILKRVQHWRTTYAEIGDRIYPRYGPAKKDDADGKRYAGMAATLRIIAKGGWNPDGTKTPPIQQYPQEMKAVIVPDRGAFATLDWKQQELRILAYMSGDANLIHHIERSIDVFAELEEILKCDRTRAKNVFYGGVAYGGSAETVARELRRHGYAVTNAEVAAQITRCIALFPGVPRWHNRLLDSATSRRYIEGPGGGRRYIYSREKRYNEILNWPIQYAGAYMLWSRLSEFRESIRTHGGDLAILQHDSITADFPPERALEGATALRLIMERSYPAIHPNFMCPVTVKIGPNWRDTKEVSGAAIERDPKESGVL